MGAFFKCILIFICCAIVFGSDVEEEYGLGRSKILSRRRRYVTFPEGSSFSCAGCITVGVIGEPAPSTSPGTFTLGMNWGIAYELPNATETLAVYHRKYRLKHQKAMAQRRNRRDLYKKLELILDNIGYSGRQCILKTLCETKQRIMPKGGNMIEEMFRMIFSLPMSKVLPIEPQDHAIYDAAHRLGNVLEDCEVFPCPISLVDWAKGRYNAPASMDSLAPWGIFSKLG